MNTKSERIMVRITPELKKRLDAYVAVIPGERSDVMRDALERYLHLQEMERDMRELYRKPMSWGPLPEK